MLEHETRLGKGVKAWNQWRKERPTVKPNLQRAFLEYRDLRGINLNSADLESAEMEGAKLGVDLSGRTLDRHALKFGSYIAGILGTPADLQGADLTEANLKTSDLNAVNLDDAALWKANLTKAKLVKAGLRHARLEEAYCQEADLREADLRSATLNGADFSGADLRGADLRNAQLVNVNFKNARLNGCRVYGIAAWGLRLDGADQSNLIITQETEAEVTVDNLEVAQFIYLLLNNEKIRDVIDTIGRKAVLILGRFTPERKRVLEAIREELRTLGYLPILFDFDPAASQSRMQTVSTLAHMARFVIADITDAKTVLQELQGIVPGSPTLPVQPLLLSGQKEPGMFDFFRLYPWFLRTVYYDSPNTLLENLREWVIEPAEGRALEIAHRLDEIRRNP